MQSINFLGKRGSLYQKHVAEDHRLFQIALASFGVTVIILLALVGFNIYLASTLQGVVKKQNDTKQSIVTNQTVEAAYLLFSHKLKAIAEIFEKRNNKQQAINYLNELFSENGFIGGVNYDGEEQILSLTVDSTNIFQLDELVKKLDSPEVKSNFASLNRSNMSRSNEGKYSMKLTIQLKKTGADQQPTVEPTKGVDGGQKE